MILFDYIILVVPRDNCY